LNQAYPDSAMDRGELIAMIHGGLQMVVELNYTADTTPAQVSD